jgi:hypothetical protein
VALTLLFAAVPAQATQVMSAALTSPSRAAASATGQSNLAALDVVVLVDESGSETAQKVADEKQTVGTIVQTMLNPSSRVTVIGFGGVNHVAPSQNPVDVVCQPTIASGTTNLDYLSSCVGGLHRRTEAEGDDTDYAAALTEAMSYLGPNSTATPAAPSGAIKVILMMTDGAVDVHRDTQQYGINWQLGEQTAINQQLAAATSAGVQLWPLGFGTDIGTGLTEPQALQYLNTMAAHGAPAVCDTRHVANQPHATWVNDPDDAINALSQLYADAACLGSSTAQGPAKDNLSVAIPAIASAAAISVDRVNPAIAVTFVQPDGAAWTDASAISGADSDSPDEVLHLGDITSADVGTWTVKLAAPPALANQLVSATVFWQGAVRAIITATPSVSPGQSIAVKLTVLGPTGPITDPATLKSLLVGVTASGQGLPSPVQVKVSPVGGPTGIGSYAGTYTAPSQPTTLTITGTAAGYGLYATQIPATVSVGVASRGFMATPHFSGVTSVQAGGSVSGSVDFTNTTGAARSVLLKLTASGAIATISPDTPIVVPSTTSGNPPSVPFTVTFSKSSPAGPAGLEVQAVDADTGQLYNAAPDEITVTTPPTFFDKYKWDGLGILVLIILLILAALWRRRVIRDRKNVRGLVAMLRFGGVQAGRELAADEKYSEVFPFVIQADTTPPYLNHPARGATTSVYQVRRGGRGIVRLMPPAGGLRPYEIEVGGPGQALGGGLEVAFRDTRHPNWAGAGAGAAAPAGYENTQGFPSMSPATAAEDWSGGGAPAHQDWSGSGIPASADWTSGGAPAAPAWTPNPPAPPREPGPPPTMPGTSPAPPPDPWL